MQATKPSGHARALTSAFCDIAPPAGAGAAFFKRHCLASRPAFGTVSVVHGQILIAFEPHCGRDGSILPHRRDASHERELDGRHLHRTICCIHHRPVSQVKSDPAGCAASLPSLRQRPGPARLSAHCSSRGHPAESVRRGSAGLCFGLRSAWRRALFWDPARIFVNPQVSSHPPLSILKMSPLGGVRTDMCEIILT